MSEERTCPVCTSTFTAERACHRYCSDRCRAKAGNHSTGVERQRRYRAKKAAEKAARDQERVARAAAQGPEQRRDEIGAALAAREREVMVAWRNAQDGGQ